MSYALQVTDEAVFGADAPVAGLTLEFPGRLVSVREIVEARVREEVARYNEEQPEYFHLLVQPADAERTLNGYRFKTKKRVDWRAQYRKAVEAFDRNGFIVLVDDVQAESLEQLVEIEPATRVAFLKLVPLVGG